MAFTLEQQKAIALAAARQRHQHLANPEATEPGLAQRIDESFQQIPGASVLSELASAANRTIGETVNFLGPDAINQFLEKTGTEFRVPRAPEPKGGFMEPGFARDIVRAAGETGVVAATAGGLARRAVTAIAPTAESTIARVGRQLGAGTAPQDVAVGVLAGAGAEVGEEVGQAVGGETGAQVGRLAGAVIAPGTAVLPVAALRSRVSPRQISKKLREAAPTQDQLRAQSDALYRQIDDLGVTFRPEKLANLSDDIARTLKKSGLDETLTPKATALLKRIQADARTELTATELDTLRKIAGTAAQDVDNVGKATLDSRLGTIVIEKIDTFLSNPKNAIGAAESKVGPLFRQARNVVSQRKKGERLEFALEKASRAASGFENGIRVEFRSILNSPAKSRGFSKDELALIERVVQGGKLENIAKLIGKFGVSVDLSSGGLLAGMTALGGLLSGSTTGAIGSAVFIAAASGMKQVARTLTTQNAELAAAIVKAGSSGRRIVSAYLKSTPKAERSTEDLASLLLSQNTPRQQLTTLRTNKNPLVANAAYISSVASSVLEVDDQVPNPSGDENEQQ